MDVPPWMDFQRDRRRPAGRRLYFRIAVVDPVVDLRPCLTRICVFEGENPLEPAYDPCSRTEEVRVLIHAGTPPPKAAVYDVGLARMADFRSSPAGVPGWRHARILLWCNILWTGTCRRTRGNFTAQYLSAGINEVLPQRIIIAHSG